MQSAQRVYRSDVALQLVPPDLGQLPAQFLEMVFAEQWAPLLHCSNRHVVQDPRTAVCRNLRPCCRCADDPAVGGAQESFGPAQHTPSEEEEDGDINITGLDDLQSAAVTVDDPPASGLPMASPASRDVDIISDSEASKHDAHAVNDEEEVPGGDTLPDGDDHSVAASRGILLSAIRKRMRNTEHDRDGNFELFHSKVGCCLASHTTALSQQSHLHTHACLNIIHSLR